MRHIVVAIIASVLSGCAATSGHGPGIGVLPATASAEEQAAEAAPWKSRCQQGFAVDCRKLGRAHLSGAGVKRDDQLAAAYLIKACEIGEPGGCSDLGVLTIIGRGVAQDDTVGGALTRRACDAGFALACSNLGTLTIEGVNRLDHRPDEEGEGGVKLLRFFETACEAGALEGCLNLATARERGQLVGKDLPGAAAALQRACSGGLPLACYRLALLGRDAPGAVPGVDLAALEAKACEGGVAQACTGPGAASGRAGPLTPTPRLVSDPFSYALGIPGAGGFHPSDLAPLAGGPRRTREQLQRIPAEQLAGLPHSLLARLQLEGRGEAGAPGDEAVELLLTLRRSQLATCLERERSNPAQAALAAFFMLESSGRPYDLHAATEPPDAGLEGCAEEVIRGWSFPAPAGGASGPHLFRFDFEAAPPGPAPGYASPGGLRAALKEPGCVERKLRVPEAYRGAQNAVTVKLAVDAAGRPALVHALTLTPDPVEAAVGAAVRACAFTAGVGEDGRPVPLWLTLTVKLIGR